MFWSSLSINIRAGIITAAILLLFAILISIIVYAPLISLVIYFFAAVCIMLYMLFLIVKDFIL